MIFSKNSYFKPFRGLTTGIRAIILKAGAALRSHAHHNGDRRTKGEAQTSQTFKIRIVTMPKIISGPVLAHMLAASDRPIFIEIRAATHIFYAKAFRGDLLAALRKLPVNDTCGLRIVEHKSGLYLSPTAPFLRKMDEIGFPRVSTMNGEAFATKLRSTKGQVQVKVPTLCGEMRIKVAKGEFADNVGHKPDIRTGLRIYSQTSGGMLVRAF